jgi:hypothetical protein
MQDMRPEGYDAERLAPCLILASSIVLEQEFAALAHEERVQAAYATVLLGLRQPLIDILR